MVEICVHLLLINQLNNTLFFLSNVWYYISFILLYFIFDLYFNNKDFEIPSDITSLNHRDIQYTTLIRAMLNKLIPFIKLWKDNTALKVVANKQKLVFRGQGEGDTKWKGCAWNWLLVKLLISFYSLSCTFILRLILISIFSHIYRKTKKYFIKFYYNQIVLY